MQGANRHDKPGQERVGLGVSGQRFALERLIVQSRDALHRGWIGRTYVYFKMFIYNALNLYDGQNGTPDRLAESKARFSNTPTPRHQCSNQSYRSSLSAQRARPRRRVFLPGRMHRRKWSPIFFTPSARWNRVIATTDRPGRPANWALISFAGRSGRSTRALPLPRRARRLPTRSRQGTINGSPKLFDPQGWPTAHGIAPP